MVQNAVWSAAVLPGAILMIVISCTWSDEVFLNAMVDAPDLNVGRVKAKFLALTDAVEVGAASVLGSRRV